MPKNFKIKLYRYKELLGEKEKEKAKITFGSYQKNFINPKVKSVDKLFEKIKSDLWFFECGLFFHHNNKIETTETKAIQTANKTARSSGAVGPNAITPKYVAATTKPKDNVLNFGAGKPDKTGKYLHSEMIRAAGGKVTEYDFGNNATGALGKKYHTVFASNVLNVQSSLMLLQQTIAEIWDSVSYNGRAVFNYPQKPRYITLTPKEVAKEIQKITEILPERVGGTAASPLWEIKRTPTNKKTK
jgi:hypothetical protein